MNEKPNVMSHVWENKDKRASKGMILSYVKDLIISNRVDMEDMEIVAEKMFKWVWN